MRGLDQAQGRTGRTGQGAPLPFAGLVAGIVAGALTVPAAHAQEGAASRPNEIATQDDEPAPLANALAAESSPYLLQHAANPVAWQPWGRAAIERARAEDKPLFVSIGYSTCYWCHVMERETFEDEAIAELINEYFIPIKVDREELPTVDDVFMTALQLRTGSGGWPLNVFLEPENLEVFFAGTYFPPEDGGGRPGFATVVAVLGERWRTGGESRAPMIEDARRLGKAVRETLAEPRPPAPLGADVVDRAVDRLLSRHDPANGGFGNAPKFPSEPDLELLAEVAGARPDAAAALERTLEAMALGGIHDHLGGGFHRYSTDATWTVPHFEKMLYTQGQLARLYARGAELFERPWFGDVAAGTLAHVARDLTGTRGRYLSAQDAEVNAREGQSYLWTPQAIAAVLDRKGLEQLAAGTARWYGVTETGNFRDPHHPTETGRSVLRLAWPPDTFKGAPPLRSVDLETIRAALLAERDSREQPSTDDKTLVAWSGLMAAGAADAGALLGDTAAIERAAAGLTFVDTTLRDGEGNLHRSWRDGRLGPLAVSEDHAFLLRGLLALHSAADSEGWLERAIEVYDEARDLYWDDEHGGWFDGRAGAVDLLPVRAKSVGDGALPCANSELLVGAVELARRTGDERFLADATAALRFLSPYFADNPAVAPRALVGLARLVAFAPEALPEAPLVPAARDSQVTFFLTAEPRAEGAAPDETRLLLALEIADGYHVNAADPGAIGLFGLSVTVSGAPDVELDAVLPAGEPFTGPLDDVVLLVLEGRVEIPLTLRGALADPAAARIQVSYQACDDSRCLPLREVALRLPDLP